MGFLLLKTYRRSPHMELYNLESKGNNLLSFCRIPKSICHS